VVDGLSHLLGSLSLLIACGQARQSERLMDVHVGLPPSGVAGGKQYLVQGSYLYYHYLQDRCGGSRHDLTWGRGPQPCWAHVLCMILGKMDGRGRWIHR
jgi:hypothetical protein